MHLISFDSGLERTGYAVFNTDDSAHQPITYGCITTSKKETLHARIAMLYGAVNELVDTYNPQIFVIERLFFSVNKKTAVIVAQAQGAVLTIAGQANIDVVFLTPTEIKSAVAGYGTADKKSMQKMVALHLGLEVAPEPDDVADAVACGLTYCTMRALHDRQA